jgi:hypothetical protein
MIEGSSDYSVVGKIDGGLSGVMVGVRVVLGKLRK